MVNQKDNKIEIKLGKIKKVKLREIWKHEPVNKEFFEQKNIRINSFTPVQLNKNSVYSIFVNRKESDEKNEDILKYILIDINIYEKIWRLPEITEISADILNEKDSQPKELFEYTQNEKDIKLEGDRRFRSGYNSYPFSFEILEYFAKGNIIDEKELKANPNLAKIEIYFIDDDNDRIMKVNQEFIFKYAKNFNTEDGGTFIEDLIDNHSSDSEEHEFIELIKRIYFPFIEVILNKFNDYKFALNDIIDDENEIYSEPFLKNIDEDELND